MNTTPGVPHYPQGRYRGRGIVMSAGGYRLLANAYVTLSRIRRLSQLPVELFYCGDEELPLAVRSQLETEFSGLTCRDIGLCAHPVQNFRGFQIKPFALLLARFQEVLWIDADNLPLQQVDELFEWDGYQRCGALFWPDSQEARWTHDDLFRACGLDPLDHRHQPEFESGQILLDKRRCWTALATVCWLNGDEMRPFVYGLTNGDKDTFRLGFLMTSTDYALVPHAPVGFGSHYLSARFALTGSHIQIGHPMGSFQLAGLLQFAPDRRPVFAHRTIFEWNPYHDFKGMTHLEGGSPLENWIRELEVQGQQDLRHFHRLYLRFFQIEWWPRCQRPLIALLLPILNLVHAVRRLLNF